MRLSRASFHDQGVILFKNKWVKLKILVVLSEINCYNIVKLDKYINLRSGNDERFIIKI